MGFGTICYFCDYQSKARFCDACYCKLKPRFKLLPNLPNISLAGYFYDYHDAFQSLIKNVKFQGNYRLADYFARHIFLPDIPSLFFETTGFVCVPSHWWRRMWRGRAHIPRMFQYVLANNHDYSPFLKRVLYSRPSSQLSRQQRLQLPSRFQYTGPPIDSVTIIDDICTTGATLSDVACQFKAIGVSTIQALVLAHRSG